jgi:hypothetical protein
MRFPETNALSALLLAGTVAAASISVSDAALARLRIAARTGLTPKMFITRVRFAHMPGHLGGHHY